MTTTTKTQPPETHEPGVIDLRPLKARLREYRQIFEYIAGGGAIEQKFTDKVFPHPATRERNSTRSLRDVHPIYNSRWSPLGIRLSTHAKPQPGERAITFVLGTHPNEISAWEGAKEILQHWRDGVIPHDVTINLVIGGAKNGVANHLQTAESQTYLGEKVVRGGGIRGFFEAVEAKDFMTIPEYVSYRSSPDNWNRVDFREDEKPMLERARELKRYAYNHSAVVASIHTTSRPGPCMVLVQTQSGVPMIGDYFARKHAKLLTPNPILPNIMLDTMNTFAKGVSSMDSPSATIHDPLSLCIETGGPHWSEEACKHGARAAMHVVRHFANEIRPGCMGESPITQEEWQKFHAQINKGVYRNPVGIFHPGHQPEGPIRKHFKEAAELQGITWDKVAGDTYILSNVKPPFPQYFIEDLQKKTGLTADEVRSKLHQRIEEVQKDRLHLQQQFHRGPLNENLLENVQLIDTFDPILIGLKDGFIVPSPRLDKGQIGHSIFAPGDPVIGPDFREQVIFLLREHGLRIEDVTQEVAFPQEREFLSPQKNEFRAPRSRILMPVLKHSQSVETHAQTREL